MTQAVPSNIIVPYFGVNFDSSQSGAESTDVPIKLLVMGQGLPTGVVDELTPYIATSADEVALNSGPGSMLHRKALYVFKNNKTVEATFVSIDDATSATAASYVWSTSGTATEIGEYVVYIAGKRVAVSVAATDTGATVQTAMAAAINALGTSIQVTAGVVSEALTVTVRNSGLAAGDLDVRFNAARGEKTPAGLTVSVVTPTAGTLDPDVTEITAVLGSTWYNVIDCPYVDETNLSAMEEYLVDVADPMIQLDALAYFTKRDTRANLITFGSSTASRNSQYVSVDSAYGRRQSTYELGSAIAALSATLAQEDPSMPFHRTTLSGIDVLDVADQWNTVQRNQLALSGIATLSDDVGVQLHSRVTMYLVNAAGISDTAYQQQPTHFTLSALGYLWRNYIQSRYARAKLAAAADNAPINQQIMTVELAYDEAVAWFKSMQRDKGYVDTSNAALAQFKAGVQVEIDSDNANRVNWLLPPDLMKQFIVGSTTIQFR